MAALKDLTAICREVVEKNPDHPARGLARLLVRKAKGAITMEQARSRVRYQLGLNGKGHRKRAKVARPPRKPGERRELPAGIAQPWTAYKMNVTGPIGIISDVHVPFHSEVAVRAAVNYLLEQDLAGLVLNGDIADFYAISRYMKDPSQRDFKGELEAVRDFLAWIRQEFPEIPIVYKLGNHEERWTHWLWQHAPEISDDPMMSLAAWFKLDDLAIDLVEDGRPILLGKLPVFHGHELPRGMAAPVNVARGVWMRLKGTGLVGHHHRTSNHAESDWRHSETANWSVGCLCDLTPEYSRINSWNHGFAIATVHKGGAFDVENFRVMHDGTVRRS